MNKIFSRSGAAVFFLLLFSCSPLNADSNGVWPAPAFQASDSNGQPLNFPADLEKPVIILFWASWCPYCKALMPHLQSIVDEYGGEIEVLALNFRDDDDPLAYIRDRGYDFRLFPDSDPIAEAWGVKTTPGLFLADPAGRVVFSNFTIPEPDVPETSDEMKHYQKAARKAPFWAARLRIAIDKLGASSPAEP
jgi:thiol-disulfide isomerase/thioredoxin